MTADELIQKATNEIGTFENPPNSNKVKYNKWFYGKDVAGAAYPWCATFISWLFKDNQDLCPKYASCIQLLDWFEKRGQIVESPKAGDIVFFKYSTNSRKTNHVGLVIGVTGNTVTTIEGNTSQTSQDNGGKVMMRRRTSNIVAYARPKYSDNTTDKTVIKDITVIAKEVIDGKWSSGNDRRQRLTKAGYNYQEVQNEVNRILGKK